MIAIRYDRAKPEMTVRGHAGYAPAGQDIVCAAVSANLYTMLENLPETKRVHVVWEPGNVRIFVPGRRARRVMDMTMKGLQAIARQYPDYVTAEMVRN